jgi:RNA polymerase sigma factor (sigma-70 family)
MRERNYGAIASFYRKNYRILVRYVQSLIADNAARDGEDIVQDVVFNMLDRADIIAPIANLSAYIYRSLRNRVIDELRRPIDESVSLETDPFPDSGMSLVDILIDTNDNPTEAMEKAEIHERMYQAIDSLPPEQKAVIIATEIEEKTFRDLSEAWAIPVGTLLARKARGIKAIRKYFTVLEKKEEELT